MMTKATRLIVATAALLAVGATPALAAEGLPGATMSLLWVLPFVGILLSIATGPVLFPHVWEHHYGKFALFWSLLVLVPLWLSFGGDVALPAVAHTLLLEYLS